MPVRMAGLVIIGAGPIGTAAALAALEDGIAESITGVVDPDPAARESIRLQTGAQGFASSADLPQARQGDRAIVAFSSRAEKSAPEIIRAVTAGYHVVTTCEELAWPERHVRDALTTTAVSNGRVIVVTGTNPGFAMDRFPLFVAGASRNVTHIEVTRRVDTSTRRATLVAKTGRGLRKDEFDDGVARGEVGHKGLAASAKLVATGLGWYYHDVRESLQPILDDEDRVAGIRQEVMLRADDGKTAHLTMVMEWGLPDPVDIVEVNGDPPMRVEIAGGYHGDLGTTAQVLMALSRCHELEPGLYRPTDLPVRFG